MAPRERVCRMRLIGQRDHERTIADSFLTCKSDGKIFARFSWLVPECKNSLPQRTLRTQRSPIAMKATTPPRRTKTNYQCTIYCSAQCRVPATNWIYPSIRVSNLGNLSPLATLSPLCHSEAVFWPKNPQDVSQARECLNLTKPLDGMATMWTLYRCPGKVSQRVS